MCAVMLDTKGPEIRTGFLENEQPIQLTAGEEVTVTTDYDKPGKPGLIAMSYKKLAEDVKPGSEILCADGSIVLKVVATDPAAGTVRCRCMNTAVLGERKNVNLPGVVVDLPTLTAKDEDDLRQWGVPNAIDFVAASFVRKGSDVAYIRSVLGEGGSQVKIISKVENQEGCAATGALGRGVAARALPPSVAPPTPPGSPPRLQAAKLRRHPGRVRLDHGRPRRPGHGNSDGKNLSRAKDDDPKVQHGGQAGE